MKIKFLFLSLFSIVLLTSCGSSKNTTYKSNYSQKASNTSEQVVQTAKSFLGTKYKYGGTTKKGMDCSGLMYVSFSEVGIQLPRRSADMASKGQKITKDRAQKGDLIFFKTGKSGAKINHVGVVSRVSKGVIYFVHSSTSKGVIESSLATDYWNKSFRLIKRIL